LGLVVLSIVALSLVDMSLASLERQETQAEAARLFAQGRTLMQKGQNLQAIDHLEDALAIQRTNRDYWRTLAQAEVEAGKDTDAESTLTQLLESDSTDGLSSLLMARLLAKQGRFNDAVSYFHRAIYGTWQTNAAQNRQRARFELIDLLAQQNSKEDLLAELLPLQDDAPKDPNTKIRIGQLLLVAGSPTRAEDTFRAVLHEEPSNADAQAGLGEAEFARGNYRTAQHDFQLASRIAPDNKLIRQRLDLCDELLHLDPTLRGIDSQERYYRSLHLVDLTSSEVTLCFDQNQSPEVRDLLSKADSALHAHVNASHLSDSSEANLDLAEQLWQVRKKDCKSSAPVDNALALLFARLAQR